MTRTDLVFAVAAYAITINLAAYMAFARDKHYAQKGMWRIPERTLLTLAAVGGTVGIIVGQQVLRHKTRKEPFRTYLLAFVAIQVIVVVVLCFLQVRSALQVDL